MRGDVKIFDFGLSKEFDPASKVGGLYNLTGDTGSMVSRLTTLTDCDVVRADEVLLLCFRSSQRYMAPEVSLGKPYNESVDVFSFAVLLYQICALEVPYQGYTVSMFEKKVMKGGHRPKPDPKWTPSITEMMRAGWGEDIFKRPSMEKVAKILRDEINSLADDDVNELLDISRKSQLSNNLSSC